MKNGNKFEVGLYGKGREESTLRLTRERHPFPLINGGDSCYPEQSYVVDFLPMFRAGS